MMTDAERPDAPETIPKNALLQQLPVMLTVELGQVELSAAEVAGLLPGSVIALHRPVGGSVDVRVGGRCIARGELLSVDDALGVRLQEIFF